MHCDICCIGHITLDRVVTPEATAHMPGGTAYYFSHALASLELDYLLVTALAESERSSVKTLEQRGVRVNVLPSSHTVFFENRYDESRKHRTQKVLRQADPFREDDLANLHATVFHLGPLLAGDIEADTVKLLSAKGRVSLDVQGLLRNVADENVVAVDWVAKQEVLPFVHYLKANEDELRVLTGSDDVLSGLQTLTGWGVKEAIATLGGEGSVVYNGREFFFIPAFQPPHTADATGCGDTYMAGYLYRRIRGGDIQQAGEFAAAMATLKISTYGPFSGTAADVAAVMNSCPVHRPKEANHS